MQWAMDTPYRPAESSPSVIKVHMDGCYELIGLIRATSDFTLGQAVQHFESRTYTQLRKPIRAELLSTDDGPSSTGFRVWYDTWAITAWVESGPDVVDDNRYLSEEPDLPASAQVVAGCLLRLSIRSDVDAPSFDNSDNFTDYTDELRERFGVLLRDNVNGGWWT
ncbi:MAG TPA: hypothetical protein VF796_00305 [Humisphaera sp.]